MLVRELKEELEARDQPKTGNKAWLRRRLHGAIVRAHLAASESHRERYISRMDTFLNRFVKWVKRLPF